MVSNCRKGDAVEIREMSEYGYCRNGEMDSAKFCKNRKLRQRNEITNNCSFDLLTNKCLRDIMAAQGTNKLL